MFFQEMKTVFKFSVLTFILLSFLGCSKGPSAPMLKSNLESYFDPELVSIENFELVDHFEREDGAYAVASYDLKFLMSTDDYLALRFPKRDESVIQPNPVDLLEGNSQNLFDGLKTNLESFGQAIAREAILSQYGRHEKGHVTHVKEMEIPIFKTDKGWRIDERE